MTVRFHFRFSLLAISRAKMSLMLPAVNGTTIRTIWFGNDAADWADAEVANAADIKAAANARTIGRYTNSLPKFPRLVHFESRLEVGVLAFELHSSEQAHRLQQRAEIRGKVLLRIRLQRRRADMHLHRLARRSRHRHRDVHLMRRVQAQIEILEKEFGRERGRPIEVHKRRLLVLREDRNHHAVVHEFEERPPAHAELLRKKRDLDEIFDDDAEHDVVRDLADARSVGLPDVEYSPRGKRLDDRLHPVESRLRAGRNARQLAGADAPAIAADRGDDVFGAARSQISTEA